MEGYDSPVNPITVNPKILGGTPCFAGTRVPVISLFDYLRRGHTVEHFLRQFPTVSKELADAVLDLAQQRLIQLDSPPQRAA